MSPPPITSPRASPHTASSLKKGTSRRSPPPSTALPVARPKPLKYFFASPGLLSGSHASTIPAAIEPSTLSSRYVFHLSSALSGFPVMTSPSDTKLVPTSWITGRFPIFNASLYFCKLEDKEKRRKTSFTRRCPF